MARTLVVVLGLAGVVFAAGCGAVKARNRQLNPSVKSDLAVNANQVRLRMRSLVDPFAGEIEQAADRISASASSPSVKRAAIRWKIEAVPEIRGALFQPDPFTAVLDTWVLTFQMEDYFESGPGRKSLGEGASIAVETSRRIEQQFMNVWALLTKSGDVSKVRAYARKWASEHPIRYAIQDRESTLSRVTETDVGASWSLGEAVADITVTADDVHREIQIYSDHLFRQARWEAELLMVDFQGEAVLPLAERAVKSVERAVKSSESAVATLDRLAPAIESAADAAAKAPALVSAERKEVTNALQKNLTETMTFLEHERLTTVKEVAEQISEERIAALAHLTQERIAALKEVHLIIANERIEGLKELHAMATNERKALSQDIEKTGFRLVDHAAWWIVRLVVATLVFLFLAAMLFLFLIRKFFFSSHEPHGWVPRDLGRRAG